MNADKFEVGEPSLSHDISVPSYSTWVSVVSEADVCRAAKAYGSTPEDSTKFAHLIAACAEMYEELRAMAEITDGYEYFPCDHIRSRALAMVKKIEDSNGK